MKGRIRNHHFEPMYKYIYQISGHRLEKPSVMSPITTGCRFDPPTPRSGDILPCLTSIKPPSNDHGAIFNSATSHPLHSPCSSNPLLPSLYLSLQPMRHPLVPVQMSLLKSRYGEAAASQCFARIYIDK